MTVSLTPINEAEAVVLPFWDPLISPLPDCTQTPGEGGTTFSQNWCWVHHC